MKPSNESRDALTLALDDRTWSEKLSADAIRISECLPDRLKGLHEDVVDRARGAGAEALILSGSTARARRTSISDCDYHVVGPKIKSDDLSSELDLHVVSPEKLMSDVLGGDDFIQWSLRFGLVVFDQAPVRDCLLLIARSDIWPDPLRKRNLASKSVDLARRFVATGDVDAAAEQVRTAVSLAARAYLLSVGVFPLSRAEMPEQLELAERLEAASTLRRCVHNTMSLPELAEALPVCEALLMAVAADRSVLQPLAG